MRWLLDLAAAAVLFLFTSCSSSPTEDDARHILEQKIQDQSEGVIKLLSFHKTDGIERDIKGTKGYQIDYTAEVEFLENCAWLGSGNWAGHDFRAWRDYSPSLTDIQLYHMEAV